MEWNKCAGKRREKKVRAFLADTCGKQTIASRLLSSALQANLRMSQAPPGKWETSPPTQLCHHFPGLFRDHTGQETHIHMYNHDPSKIRAPHLCSGVNSTCHHPTRHTHLPTPSPPPLTQGIISPQEALFHLPQNRQLIAPSKAQGFRNNWPDLIYQQE